MFLFNGLLGTGDTLGWLGLWLFPAVLVSGAIAGIVVELKVRRERRAQRDPAGSPEERARLRREPRSALLLAAFYFPGVLLVEFAWTFTLIAVDHSGALIDRTVFTIRNTGQPRRARRRVLETLCAGQIGWLLGQRSSQSVSCGRCLSISAPGRTVARFTHQHQLRLYAAHHRASGGGDIKGRLFSWHSPSTPPPAPPKLVGAHTLRQEAPVSCGGSECAGQRFGGGNRVQRPAGHDLGDTACPSRIVDGPAWAEGVFSRGAESGLWVSCHRSQRWVRRGQRCDGRRAA